MIREGQGHEHNIQSLKDLQHIIHVGQPLAQKGSQEFVQEAG